MNSLYIEIPTIVACIGGLATYVYFHLRNLEAEVATAKNDLKSDAEKAAAMATAHRNALRIDVGLALDQVKTELKLHVEQKALQTEQGVSSWLKDHATHLEQSVQHLKDNANLLHDEARQQRIGASAGRLNSPVQRLER